MQLPRLKEWRLRRALAQRDLAAASSVGLTTINRVERGLQLARPSTARRLAEALGVQPDALMEEPKVGPHASGEGWGDAKGQ